MTSSAATSPVLCWNPLHCALRLTLERTRGDATIGPGTTYRGTSTILYRREALLDASPPSATGDLPDDSAAATAASDYQTFLNRRRAIAESGALHLHALTSAEGPYTRNAPLTIQSYRLTGGSAASTTLSITKVVAEDEIMATKVTPAPAASSLKRKKSAPEGKKQEGKRNNARSKADMKAAGEPEPKATAENSMEVDHGSKLVYFTNSTTLPRGAEVELVVHFTGTVQHCDVGGIYAAATSATGGAASSDAALLTHFEVTFARAAFPCPDHPQYRLEWQLQSIQLPENYDTVLTNASEVSRKSLAAQRMVQMEYSTCGPLPAYTFSFAAFPSSPGSAALTMISTSLSLTPLTETLPAAVPHDSSPLTIPLRVFARPQAGVELSTMEWVMRIAVESVGHLQRLFCCPLPLLQCNHLDILLGPTMPYISGMEHHCSVILNETIYASPRDQRAKAFTPLQTLEQITLIVHELTHHWVGNAIGMPFSVKEGICQLLEECYGDVLQGRPMRKYTTTAAAMPFSDRPDAAVTSPSSSSNTNAEAASAAVTNRPRGKKEANEKSQIVEIEKGKEFTSASYQSAFSSIKDIVAEEGFDIFAKNLRRMMQELLVEPAVALEAMGGVTALRYSGEDLPPAPFISREEFLERIQQP